MNKKKSKEKFGSQLSRWRIEAGKTQARLDHILGKSRETRFIHQVERGRLSLTREQAVKVAEALQRDHQEVLMAAMEARADPEVLEYYRDLLAAGEGWTEEERRLVGKLRSLDQSFPGEPIAGVFDRLLMWIFDPMAEKQDRHRATKALLSALRTISGLPCAGRLYLLEAFDSLATAMAQLRSGMTATRETFDSVAQAGESVCAEPLRSWPNWTSTSDSE